MSSDHVTLSLATALACAAAVWLVAITGRSAQQLWRRLRKAPLAGTLMHRPGHAYARRIEHSQWRVQATLASLAAAMAGGLTSAALATPPNILAGWQQAGISITSVVALTLIAVGAIAHAWHSRKWHRQHIARELVSQHLHRIGGERDRVFHDVPLDDGSWIDHVLLGVQGAFAVVVVAAPDIKPGIAERDGDRLLLNEQGTFIDLAEARQRVNRLQHRLSKQLGRMIRLRAVVALPGWRIRNNNGDDVLIVGHSDIVMIKGWRNANDGLMNEDADALQAQLEQLTTRPFRPEAGALAEHEPIVRPQRDSNKASRGNKAAATA